MSSNLTPFNSDGGFNTTGNVVAGNITTGGIANVNSMNISQSIRWDYSGSQIYEDGGLVINGPGGVLAQGNVAAQFEFNDGVGNSSGLYSTIEESVVYSVEYVTIRANNSGTQTDWTFGTDGNLTIPSGGAVWNIGNGTAGLTANILDPYQVNLGLDYTANTATLNANTGVYIQTNSGNTQWAFLANSLMTAPGAISAVGNITGGNITTAGSGGDIILTGGNITGAGNISAGNVSTTGNITAANFIGNTFSIAQTILPTIQSIVISNTSSEYETSGGSGYANVLVANVAPVIEYGVIVTAGSTVDKYVTGNLANIPGTEKITISTGTSDQPFTVYAYVTTNAGTYYSGPEVGFSGMCLLKGTMISLADGTYKPIEDINNDDLLLTWDFDLGRYAQSQPLWIKRGETGTRYNQLTFSDGTILRTFDQHRIFNKQAGAFTYPMSDDTPVGTVTINEHGQEITLVKRDLVWDTIEHYNIITNHHINLFADSVLTSCRFNNIYPITDMKFVKSIVLNRNLSEFAEIESRFVSGLRLQEQPFELAMIEGYVNRLLATEAMESIGV